MRRFSTAISLLAALVLSADQARADAITVAPQLTVTQQRAVKALTTLPSGSVPVTKTGGTVEAKGMSVDTHGSVWVGLGLPGWSMFLDPYSSHFYLGGDNTQDLSKKANVGGGSDGHFTVQIGNAQWANGYAFRLQPTGKNAIGPNPLNFPQSTDPAYTLHVIDNRASDGINAVTDLVAQEGKDQHGTELFGLATQDGTRIVTTTQSQFRIAGGTLRPQVISNVNLAAAGVTARAFYAVAQAPNGDRYGANASTTLYKQTGGAGDFVAVAGVTLPAVARSVCVTPSGDVIVPTYNGPISKLAGGAGPLVQIDSTTRLHWGCATDGAGKVYVTVFGGSIYTGTAAVATYTDLSQTSRNWTGVATVASGSSYDVHAVVYGGGRYKQTAETGNFVEVDATARDHMGITANQSTGDLYLSTNNGSTGALYLVANATGTAIDIGQGNRLWTGGCVSSSGVVAIPTNGGDLYTHAGRVGWVATPGADMVSKVVIPPAALTANTSLLVNVNGMLAKQFVRVVRMDRTAYTLTIRNGGGTPADLITLPASPTQNVGVDLEFSGTDLVHARTEYLD